MGSDSSQDNEEDEGDEESTNDGEMTHPLRASSLSLYACPSGLLSNLPQNRKRQYEERSTSAEEVPGFIKKKKPCQDFHVEDGLGGGTNSTQVTTIFIDDEANQQCRRHSPSLSLSSDGSPWMRRKRDTLIPAASVRPRPTHDLPVLQFEDEDKDNDESDKENAGSRQEVDQEPLRSLEGSSNEGFSEKGRKSTPHFDLTTRDMEILLEEDDEKPRIRFIPPFTEDEVKKWYHLAMGTLSVDRIVLTIICLR